MLTPAQAGEGYPVRVRWSVAGSTAMARSPRGRSGDAAGIWECNGDDFIIRMALQGHVGGEISGTGTYFTPFTVTGSETGLRWEYADGSSAQVFSYVRVTAHTLELRYNSAANSPGFSLLRQ
jgi:hypothetical protein